jgi:hypothetical protein
MNQLLSAYFSDRVDENVTNLIIAERQRKCALHGCLLLQYSVLVRLEGRHWSLLLQVLVMQLQDVQDSVPSYLYTYAEDKHFSTRAINYHNAQLLTEALI